MALPAFERDRRIDIVDALNELSTAADAAIEAGGGSSSYVLPVAADAVLCGAKGQRAEEKNGNGMLVSESPAQLTCAPVSCTSSSSGAKNTLLKAAYSRNKALLTLSAHSAPTNYEPDNKLNYYCNLNILTTVK